MARYDPFKEMDRMLEQFHTRVLIPEGSLSGVSGCPPDETRASTWT
jgi:hypothetical protein